MRVPWWACGGSLGKIHQAFSLRFCILQAIKNWSWGRPGNKAIHAHWTSFCMKQANWIEQKDGCIFESCDISLGNMPTSHAVSLALGMYSCSDSAMPPLSCACLCSNSKWCLPSFVNPSPCTVLLLPCLKHVLGHKWVGVFSFSPLSFGPLPFGPLPFGLLLFYMSVETNLVRACSVNK